MINSILIVCIGNICRSPVAEAMFGERLRDKSIKVSSAGLGALVGYSADPISQQLISNYGLDISHHRARQITKEIVLGCDLIITMTSDQRRQVEKRFPVTSGRVHRIGNWSGFDVVDPYKRPKAIFEQAFALIDQAVDDWCEKYFQLDCSTATVS
jgi:protein-tyrosine phosphatase